MGNPAPRFAVLLALLLGAAAGAAARPCIKHQPNAEALDVLPLFAADDISKDNTLGPLQHHGDCKVRCNDEEPEAELNTECWGTHLLVCKGNSSIMATKCEGHFVGIHILDQHMWIGVCEGLSHKFGHWHSTCPKTGRIKRKFFGKGCLGEGSAIIRVHHASNTTAEPNAPTTVAATLATTVSSTTDPAMDALAAELKRSTASFNSLRIGGDNEEYKGASFESRCKGRGGDVFGAKWGSRDDDDDVPARSSDLASVFYYLQGSVTESLGSVPEDLQLGSTFPTAAQRAAWRLANIQLGEQGQAAEDSSIPKPAEQEQEAHENRVTRPLVDAADQVTSTPLVAMVQLADTAKPNHPSCSLTCNDKTPWLKGKWPCYGELSVSCSADSPGGKTMEFSASCKGLWTGMFGKMCWGLTLQHSTKTWPSGEAHMDGICSGKQGIWSHRGGNENEGVFAMGQWCRGGGVGHGSFEKEEVDQPVQLVAAM